MSTKPGILFVLSDLGIGGSEIKIIKIANALSRSGTKVELAYLNPPVTALDIIDPAVPLTHLNRRGKYSLNTLRQLICLMQNEFQTIVAVNLYPLLYVIPGVKWWQQRNVRAVGLVNTADLVGRDRVLGEVYAPLLRRCDEIVFGCMTQRTLWARKFRLPLDRSEVIYNGVDHEFYSPTSVAAEGTALRRKLGIPEGAIIIGSIGRLAPEKNFEDLIVAAARLNAAGRETYVIFAGQGAERERLEQLAVGEHIGDKVSFLGAQTDVRPAISTMDVFVLPSVAVETFSNAALEAMAMARAVVISDIGGAAEMVEQGKSGIVFPVGDIDSLTEVLTALYDSSDMRRRLGTKARQRVLDSFAFTNMVDQYRNLLSSR